MSIVLWVLQGLLAFAFLGAGGIKLVTPIPELLANGMAFVGVVPEALTRFIGLSEVLGAIGLILPAALRIQPSLTPIAAALLAVVMVLGVFTHIGMGDAAGSAPAAVLGVLCAVVAYGRWRLAPISPR